MVVYKVNTINIPYYLWQKKIFVTFFIAELFIKHSSFYLWKKNIQSSEIKSSQTRLRRVTFFKQTYYLARLWNINKLPSKMYAVNLRECFLLYWAFKLSVYCRRPNSVHLFSNLDRSLKFDVDPNVCNYSNVNITCINWYTYLWILKFICPFYKNSVNDTQICESGYESCQSFCEIKV